jgi:hypothetical protein
MFLFCSHQEIAMPVLADRPPTQQVFDFSRSSQPGEWPLRAFQPGHGSRFTAWRGRSGRRYVTSCYAVDDDDALGFADSVLIAVDATRRIIGVREAGPWGLEAAVNRWRDEMQSAGAIQIHVHLIAATAEDRLRAITDLTPVH